MSFWRKLFEMNHGEGRRHRRRGTGHYTRYRPDDHNFDNEGWGRHPGSVPPMAPDVICPECRKSNAPGTRACKQCNTPFDRAWCTACRGMDPPGARYCANCRNPVG